MIRHAALSALATGSRALTSIALIKLAAVLGGPSAVLVVANCQSFMSVLVQLATAGVAQGVVKCVAESREDPIARGRIISTAGTITGICACFLAAFLWLSCEQISKWVFLTVEYAWLVRLASTGLVIVGGYQIALSVANGDGKFGRYARLSIGGDLSTLGVTASVLGTLGWRSALVGAVIGQAVGALAAAAYCLARRRLKRGFDFQFDRRSAAALISYSLMAVVGLLTAPITQIIVRRALTNIVGPEQAGYWQALWSISDGVVGLAAATLAAVLLPHFARSPWGLPLRASLIAVYRWLLPASAVAAFLLWCIRDTVILLLFAPEFLPARAQFGLVACASAVRMAAWLLGFLMLARQRTRAFVASEIFFNLSFALLAVLLAPQWGLDGVAVAYLLNYLAYMTFLAAYFRPRLAAGY